MNTFFSSMKSHFLNTSVVVVGLRKKRCIPMFSFWIPAEGFICYHISPHPSIISKLYLFLLRLYPPKWRLPEAQSLSLAQLEVSAQAGFMATSYLHGHSPITQSTSFILHLWRLEAILKSEAPPLHQYEILPLNPSVQKDIKSAPRSITKRIARNQ